MLKPPRQQVYLLRCWEERHQNTEAPPMWRFNLEHTQTGQRHGFADLDALIAFLRSSFMNTSLDKPPATVADKPNGTEALGTE